MRGPLLSEVGQSLYLMVLAGFVVAAYLGLGLLLVRVLG
jgi:hypothetical protein